MGCGLLVVLGFRVLKLRTLGLFGEASGLRACSGSYMPATRTCTVSRDTSTPPGLRTYGACGLGFRVVRL